MAMYVVDKIYAQTVQGLADCAQKLTYNASLAAPDPSLTFIANLGWTVPDYYYA